MTPEEFEAKLRAWGFRKLGPSTDPQFDRWQDVRGGQIVRPIRNAYTMNDEERAAWIDLHARLWMREAH